MSVYIIYYIIIYKDNACCIKQSFLLFSSIHPNIPIPPPGFLYMRRFLCNYSELINYIYKLLLLVPMKVGTIITIVGSCRILMKIVSVHHVIPEWRYIRCDWGSANLIVKCLMFHLILVFLFLLPRVKC